MSLDVELALKEEKLLGELVTVEDVMHPSKGKCVVVRAKAWLGGDWHKVNELLKAKFPKVEWISLGKESHWCIPLESIMKPQAKEISARTISKEEKPQFPIPLAPKKETTQPQTLENAVLEEIVVPKELRWKYLIDEGKKAREVKDGMQWLLGDLALTVQKEYGHNKLGEYADAVNVEKKTLEAYRRTSKIFEKDKRSSFLPWSYFFVTSTTNAPSLWIEKVIENEWSIADLREAIILEKARRKKEFGWELPEDIFVENIWKWEDSRPDYGSSKFRGNCDGRILIQIIKRYCPNAKFVIDPMAGSGTSYDVCKHLGIKCFAFDIIGNKWHKEIKFGDATEPWQIPWDEKADVIFIHFPYWNMVEYTKEYDTLPQYKEKDVSIIPLDDFLARCSKILENAKPYTYPNTYIVILIGLLRRQGILYDLPSDFSKLGQKYFQLYDKIVKVGWAGRETSAHYDYGEKPLPFCRINYETLLVFKMKQNEN